jgi:hypothetical protein
VALLIVLYWLFDIFKVPFIANLMPVFEPIRNFTHIFYKSPAGKVDFAFFIASVASLFFAWFLTLVIEFLEFLCKCIDRIHNQLLVKEEAILNQNLQKESIEMEKINNKFIFLITFQLVNILYDAKYEVQEKEENERKANKILENIFSKFNETLKCQSKVYDSSILLYFENFDQIDIVLKQIFNLIILFKNELAREKWKLTFNGALEVYSKRSEMTDKCKNLFALNRLGIKNQLICLSSFKHRYSIQQKTNFELIDSGLYTMNGNEVSIYNIKKKDT